MKTAWLEMFLAKISRMSVHKEQEITRHSNQIMTTQALKIFPREKFSQYSFISIWFTIAFKALIHNKFECPKCLSHSSPLVHDSLIGLLLLLRSSRKCWLFLSDTWKVIFYLLKILSYSFFLLKSYDVLWSPLHVYSITLIC